VTVRALFFCFFLAFGGAAAEDEVTGRAWLGVYLGKSTGQGVEILAVVAGGPAHRAGLRSGDVLTSLGDATIRATGDVSGFLSGAPPGADVVVGFLREGKPASETIELRSRPERRDSGEAGTARTTQADALRRAARLGGLSGITLAEIPDELRAHYGAPRGTGVLVTRVARGSVSADAGVAVGDVLTRVGDTVVREPGDLPAALSVAGPGSELEIEVVRARTPVVIVLDLAPATTPGWRGVEEGDGAERSIRIRLLENELRRLEQRMREVHEELERLKDRR
jgi:serine protease Do